MSMYRNNPITRSDSYKMSHWPLYPEGTTNLYSYLESRGGLFTETVMFGTQYYLREYLTTPITMEMIDYAEKRIKKHFGSDKIFNRAGWEYIVKNHAGRLPVHIKAVPEGTVVPTRNVLMTIEATDPNCAWLVNYLETLLLKVWYPITVATLSREIKKIILDALVKTGTPEAIAFKLHDFGYRGVSSEESADIGGAAHLVNFMGTDTFHALEFIDEYYADGDGEYMAGYSIPATEHSIMSALGEMGEVEQMRKFLDVFGSGPFPAIACVSDTYNIYEACDTLWGKVLKNQVVNLRDKVLVVRPDSGDPVEIVRQVVETLDRAFGNTVNEKGFKVLNSVRVIQGDGINITAVKAILDALIVRGWSADNIAFGMGGALLQQVNRDTQKFAFKASSITIRNNVRDVFKSPITDNGKRSKRGRLKLIWNDGVLETVSVHTIGLDVLETVYLNGEPVEGPNFEDIRARAVLAAPATEYA